MDRGEARYHQLRFVPLMKSPAAKSFWKSPPPVTGEKKVTLLKEFHLQSHFSE